MTPLITDAELLGLGIAANALNGILVATRDMQREAASDFVRGKVAPRYSGILDSSLSDTDVSFDIKLAIASVAAYHLMGTKGYNPTKGAEAQIKGRYDTAMAWLEDIRTYKAELVDGAALDRGGVLVGGTDSSNWEDWRNS